MTLREPNLRIKNVLVCDRCDWSTKLKVLMASGNLLEGTLPNLVDPGLQAVYLSGVAGRSRGESWDLVSVSRWSPL